MPLVKSFILECRAYIVTVILSLGEIMPTYSCCVLKGLACIIIIILFGRQPSSYVECTKSNIYSSCNVRSVSVNKYIFLHGCARSCARCSLLVLYLSCHRVSHSIGGGET